MKQISLKDLLEAGSHFGHQVTRWNPKMMPYIFASRDRIHIFDLVKTKEGLEKAAAFAKATASQGGKIIFVGTKRQSQDIIKAAALKVGMPYITERWVGGLLTNFDQVKKRINYLSELKTGKLEGKFKDRTKKENLLIDREIIKLERVFGGVADLKEIPAAVFVIDGKKDLLALKEARSRGAKTIALVDTNTDPDNVDFVIPANDDAVKSIQLVVDYITEAVEEGQKESQKSKEKETEKKKVKEVKKEPKVKKVKEKAASAKSDLATAS